mgnify:CR=1 FL=1
MQRNNDGNYSFALPKNGSNQQIRIRSDGSRIVIVLLVSLFLFSASVLMAICAFVREALFLKVFSAYFYILQHSL